MKNFTFNNMAESRRQILFPEVTDEQWNDWKWQVKNRIETLDDLKKINVSTFFYFKL